MTNFIFITEFLFLKYLTFYAMIVFVQHGFMQQKNWKRREKFKIRLNN